MEYTQTELRVMALLSMIGAAFSFLVGGVNGIVTALLVFIAVDYVTGMAAAWMKNQLSSARGFDGILRKLTILIVVVIAHQLDAALSMPDTFRSMAVFAYLGNEGISICENIDRIGCGKYIPEFLRAKLIQLRDEKQSIGGKVK